MPPVFMPPLFGLRCRSPRSPPTPVLRGGHFTLPFTRSVWGRFKDGSATINWGFLRLRQWVIPDLLCEVDLTNGGFGLCSLLPEYELGFEVPEDPIFPLVKRDPSVYTFGELTILGVGVAHQTERATGMSLDESPNDFEPTVAYRRRNCARVVPVRLA